MKKTFITLSAIALILLSALPAFAQKGYSEEDALIEALKNKPLHGMFGMSFINSVPQNEFFKNVGKAGPGVSIMGGYTFSPVPITIGLQTDLLFYGGDERVFNYYNSGGWIYARDTISYNNFLIPVTASIMIRPDIENLIFPYFELFGGFTMISASADFKGNYGSDDSKDEFDAAWNYGVGAGTMFKLVDFITLPEFKTRLLLDIKARYMFGTQTNYYIIERINSDSSPEFKKNNSTTDMVTFQVGFVFEF